MDLASQETAFATQLVTIILLLLHLTIERVMKAREEEQKQKEELDPRTVYIGWDTVADIAHELDISVPALVYVAYELREGKNPPYEEVYRYTRWDYEHESLPPWLRQFAREWLNNNAECRARAQELAQKYPPLR